MLFKGPPPPKGPIPMKFKKWLLFVEDPGAVNYFLPLVKIFAQNKVRFSILGSGQALKIFSKQGIKIQSFSRYKIARLKKDYDIVLVGTSENHISPSFSLLKWAKNNNIFSVGLVDSGINAPYRFRGRSSDPLRHAPDALLVPDEWAVQQFEALGFSRKKINVIGYAIRTKKLPIKRSVVKEKILPKASSAKFVILFVSESPKGLCSTQFQKNGSFTLHGTSGSKDRTLIVIEELFHALKGIMKKNPEKMFLILRLHPKETPFHLKSVLKKFDYVSRIDDPVKIANCADLVIGMSSMLLIEAFLNKRDCFAIVPKPQEKKWIPMWRSGAIPCASNRKEIKSLLNAKLCRLPSKYWKSASENKNIRNGIAIFQPEQIKQKITELKHTII